MSNRGHGHDGVPTRMKAGASRACKTLRSTGAAREAQSCCAPWRTIVPHSKACACSVSRLASPGQATRSAHKAQAGKALHIWCASRHRMRGRLAARLAASRRLQCIEKRALYAEHAYYLSPAQSTARGSPFHSCVR